MSAAYVDIPTRHTRNFREASLRQRCAVCDHLDWCRVFDDGAWECMRTPNDHPCRSGGWLYWPNGRPDNWRERIATLPPRPPRPTADPDLMHRTSAELLALCPLSEAHRAGLHARGLSNEQADRHGYGSLPDDGGAQERIAQAVAQAIGCDPAGRVPGFIRRNSRLTLVNLPGLLIPVRNTRGHIVGVKVRPDEKRPGRKYVWFSAGDGEGSIGQTGSVVHVAYPPRPASRRRVVLTEGPLKANIAADLLGLIALAVDGVSNTAGLLDELAALAALSAVEEVLIGYDEDAESNEHVAAAEGRTAHMLTNAGYRVMQLTWPAAAGKGLDDILTSTPPTIPVALAHPALSTPAAAAAAPSGDEVARELVTVKRLHSLSSAARRSPNLGSERHTLVDFATALSPQPEGEWVPMPYSKVGDQAGVDARTVERQLKKAGIRPAAGDAGILTGLVDVAVQEVPERVNPQTGEVSGGYKAMHVRRLAPVTEILERIATAPPSEAGKRNNHGGKRAICPKCGPIDVERTVTDRCTGCGEILKQTVRLVGDDDEDETPPRHLDVDPPADNVRVVVMTDPTVTVRRDDKLSPTPPSIGQRARAAAQDRRQFAAEHLAAWQNRMRAKHENDSPPESDEPPEELSGLPPVLTLFPLEGAECAGCGAAIDDGHTHCPSCAWAG